MTRDEAISVLVNNQAICIQNTTPLPHRIDCAAADVASLVALGLLKLDDTSSIAQRIVDAIKDHPDLGNVVSNHVTEALEWAGLKIVEIVKR